MQAEPGRCSKATVLYHAFKERGIDARVLVGATPAHQRAALLQDFKDGLYPVLVNCAILTEGADVPAIDCVGCSLFFLFETG